MTGELHLGDARAYYNDNDAYCAQWLRNLVAAGHITSGEVDERDIAEVEAEDLKGCTQVHLFAGIGVWSHALRQAGWPDARRVWTGSVPCQPFSAAGRRLGTSDERHLWPAMFRLIRECRPDTVLGEQVASDDGLAWLDLVSADLESEDYACGAVDLCAAGVGAPHIRQRLWWVAHARGEGLEGRRDQPAREEQQAIERGGRPSGLADARNTGGVRAPQVRSEEEADKRDGDPSPLRGFWRDADWLSCADGKARPVESGTFPLAHGVAGRVGRLRAYGNSLVAPCAEAFVRAVMETLT